MKSKIINKITAILLIILCTLTCVSFAQEIVPVQNSNMQNLPGDVKEDADIVAKVMALGFMAPCEDGSFSADKIVTRGEFADAMALLLGLGNIQISPDGAFFLDVTEENSHRSSVMLALKIGYMTGYTDGTFRTEMSIKVRDAVRVLIKALGYNDVSGNKDLISVANSIGLLKGIRDMDLDLTRMTLAKLIDNALKVDFLNTAAVGEYITYQSEKNESVLEGLHNIYTYTGVMTGNSDVRLDTSGDMGKSRIMVGDMVFSCENSAVWEYLGYKIKVYYTDEDADDEYEVIYAELYGKNTVVSVDAEDVLHINIRNIKYFDSDTEQNITEQFSGSLSVVRNGQCLFGFTGQDLSCDTGNYRLIDNNGDGEFEILFISDVKNYVVQNYSSFSEILSFKYGEGNFSLKETAGRRVKITKNGERIEAGGLKEWDVVSILESKDGKTAEVLACSETVSATVDSISEASSEVILDGNAYRLDKQFMKTERFSALKAGKEGKFYFNEYGKIVAFEAGATDTEAYGYLTAYTLGKGIDESVQIKLLTTSSKLTIFELRDKITFACGLQSVSDDSYKIFTYSSSSEQKPYAGVFVNSKNEIVPQLVKYSTDQEGKIRKLVAAVDRSALPLTEQTDTTVFCKNFAATDLRIMAYSLGANYRADANSKVFNVPESIDQLSNEKNMNVESGSSFSGDVRRENVEVYDASEDGFAKVIVSKTAGGEGSMDRLSTAIYQGQNFSVVTKVANYINDNGEESTKIYCYQAGAQKSYVTADAEVKNITNTYNFWYTTFQKYGNLKASELRAGDVFLYDTNVAGEVNKIQVLLSPSDLPDSYNEVLTDGGTATPGKVLPDTHLAQIHTAYGVVVGKGANSIFVNANGDGTNSAWIKRYNIASAHMYLYDTAKKKVVKCTASEVQIGDKILERDRQHTVKEVLIIR